MREGGESLQECTWCERRLERSASHSASSACADGHGWHLRPLVRPHQIAARNDVAFHRVQQIVPRRARGKIELGVERVDAEEVAVRLAARRAWAAVAGALEVVGALTSAA